MKISSYKYVVQYKTYSYTGKDILEYIGSNGVNGTMLIENARLYNSAQEAYEGFKTLESIRKDVSCCQIWNLEVVYDILGEITGTAEITNHESSI